MHLLNVYTLRLETFFDTRVPKYAILSHTWGEGEVTFADIQDPTSPRTTGLAGFQKIRKTCDHAKADRYQYVWIDTCCIDKSSSAELSEAINSMFKWYADAGICYAYVSDVTKANFKRLFPKCRWYTRGWTLQELLAPGRVVFYDQTWERLGTRDEHADWISKITGIDVYALRELKTDSLSNRTERILGRFCIAQRMSWASKRETTRVEDIAYCLLGLFGINMPLLYGEGQHAFIRLQEELIKRSDDDSVLAWGQSIKCWDWKGPVSGRSTRWRSVRPHSLGCSPLLAKLPSDFQACGGIRRNNSTPPSPFAITNAGLESVLPLIPLSPQSIQDGSEPLGWIGLLGCTTGVPGQFLGMLLVPRRSGCLRQDRDSPIEVQRVNDPNGGTTVIVGLRSAFQAQPRKVSIVQEEVGRTLKDRRQFHNYLMVTESRALLAAGYNVTNAELYTDSWELASPESSEWDLTTKIFTVMGRFEHSLVCFTFGHHEGDEEHGFRVLMHRGKILVCKGICMTKKERDKLSEVLVQSKLTQNNTSWRPVNDAGVHISATIKHDEVRPSRMIQVEVDAVAGADWNSDEHRCTLDCTKYACIQYAEPSTELGWTII